jgi:hypothetical protein
MLTTVPLEFLIPVGYRVPSGFIMGSFAHTRGVTKITSVIKPRD